MEYLKIDDKVLVVHADTKSETNCKELLEEIKLCVKSAGEIVSVQTKDVMSGSMKEGTYDTILSGLKVPFYHTPELLREYYRLLKPGGALVFEELFKETSMDDPELIFYPHYSNRLKLNGFIVQKLDPEMKASPVTKAVGYKPTYEASSKVGLKIQPNKHSSTVAEEKTAWKINDDEDDELIDESTLIDPTESLKNSSVASLACKPNVGNSENKKKACKNCTCGLAEQEENEGKDKTAANEETQKSSCGNCYLGDAFRCSSCPYLGMPAFKPGEKVVIPSMD